MIGQSQFGPDARKRGAGFEVLHHLSAVIAVAEEDDFDGEIISIKGERELAKFLLLGKKKKETMNSGQEKPKFKTPTRTGTASRTG